MLNWFSRPPKCPIRAEEKSWIEEGFNWLASEFGLSTLRSARTVEPTPEYFPAAYEPNESSVDDLKNRVANYMNVDPDFLQLSYYDDDRPVIGDKEVELFSSNNDYEIWLEVHSLHDPAGVVAALSREIAHVQLVLRNREISGSDDHEELSELMAVFSGAGIFLANTALFDTNWTEGGWTGWQMAKSSYLSMDMFAYALALYALARNEDQPAWARHLRPDVRVPLKKSIRYIVATGDCSFEPAQTVDA